MSSKLKKNIFLVGIGSFSSKVLVFLLVPLYTSVLSTEEYGTVDLIFITVSLLMPLFTCVVFESMFRYLLDKDIDQKDIVTVGLIVNLIGLVGFLLFSPAVFLFPNLKEYYILIVLYYFSYTLYENLSYITRGLEKMALFSVSGVLSTLLVIFFNLLFLLKFNLGIKGYLLSYIWAYFVSSVFVIFVGKIHKLVVFPQKRHIDVLRMMMKYSLPLVPNSLSWWVSNSSDKYILTMYHGAGTSGLYAVSYKIPSIANAISSVFNSAWQTSAVDFYNSEETASKYGIIFESYFTFQLFGSMILILFSKILSYFLFQNDFFEAWNFVPILCIASFFHSLGEFLGAIYRCSQKTKAIFYSTLTAALSNIILNFILIPRYHGYGAAIATMISYFIVFIIRFVHGRRIICFPVHSVRLTICILLILVAMIFMCCNTLYSWLLCGGILLVLFGIQYKSVLSLAKQILCKK